jgi:hypothetical protein
LATAPITVHKDSSQQRASFGKAAVTGRHRTRTFVDTTQQDHKRYNDGDSETGFNKEIYQLANKIGQLYSRGYFHIYPDYRDTKNTPEELRLILCRAAAKRGDKRDWPTVRRPTSFRADVAWR